MLKNHCIVFYFRKKGSLGRTYFFTVYQFLKIKKRSVFNEKQYGRAEPGEFHPGIHRFLILLCVCVCVRVCVCVFMLFHLLVSSGCTTSVIYVRSSDQPSFVVSIFWVCLPSSFISISESILFHLQRRKPQPFSYWRENDMI